MVRGMDHRVWPAVGLGTLGVGVLVGAWWALASSADPGPVPHGADAPEVRAEASKGRATQRMRPRRLRRRRAPAEATEAASVDAAAAEARARPARGGEGRGARDPREPREPRERVLAPEELAWARTEFRYTRLDDMHERLDELATAQGWESGMTERVRGVLSDTIATITEQLTQVDRGERPWGEAKRELRAYRAAQAAEVEAILGPERFRRFAAEMGFERFVADAPAKARTRGRRPN